jgi:hypothetical protein
VREEQITERIQEFQKRAIEGSGSKPVLVDFFAECVFYLLLCLDCAIPLHSRVMK